MYEGEYLESIILFYFEYMDSMYSTLYTLKLYNTVFRFYSQLILCFFIK